MASKILTRLPRASDGEEDDSADEHDEHRHNNLLQAIANLHGKKKFTPARSETSKATEFHADVDGKVRVHELVRALPQSVHQKKLRKQLNRAESKTKTLEQPMHRHERELLERETGYEKTSKDLDRWQPLIHRNRKAEHMQFPLPTGEITVVDTEAFVSRFKSKNTLEDEVARLLGKSENVVQPGEMLSEAEKRALKAMDEQEAKERRIMLQKHRALISYKYAKSKHQAKIKSRSYHRILRKERTKKERAELDKLMEDDPEAFMERIEELEKQRIKERMSLKHKVKSRRLRKQALFSKYDNNMRDAVQEMIRKGKELTQKHRVESDDEDDSDDVTTNVMTQTVARQQAGGNAAKNPWMSAGIKVKKPKYSKPVAVTNKETIDIEHMNDEESETDSEDENMATSDVIENIFAASVNSKNKSKQSDKSVVSNKSKDKAIRTLKAERIMEKSKTAKKSNTRQKQNAEIESDEEMSGDDMSSDEDDSETEMKPEPKKEKKGSDASSSEEEQDEGLELSSKRRQRLKDFEDEWFDETEVQPSASGVEPATSAPKNQTEADDASKSEVKINPEEFMTVETNIGAADGLTLIDEEGDDDDDEEQRMTIAQAFAEDDVVAEFTEEKKTQVDEEQPQDVDLTLPGWGSWGGEGVVPKKKKVLKAPKLERKDDNKDHVIITQARDNKAVKYQINKLPFPYNKAESYEAYIRQPLGKTWNTETSYRKLTQPKVRTKLGAVINPISKDDITKFEDKQHRETEEHYLYKNDKGQKRRSLNSNNKRHENKNKKRKKADDAPNSSVIKI